MGIISNIEAYMLATGKARDYTERVANNCTIVNVLIPKSGLQSIFLQRNELLDSKKIRAIEVVCDDQIIDSQLPDGKSVGVLESVAVSAFTFVLAKNNDNKVTIPLACLHRTQNNGKFCFIDSDVGNHRISDCFLEQNVSGDISGVMVVLRFWYD